MNIPTNAMSRRLLCAATAIGLSQLALPAAAVEFAPTANVQYEWARFDSDLRASANEDDFRRARLGFKIKGGDGKWHFAAEHDFADKTPADAYLELMPAKGHAIRIGQFKQPFLLEDAISDKHSALLEQSLVGVFAISRRMGVEYARYGDRGTVSAALFGKRLDGTNESIGATMRATWIPVTAGEGVHRHLGFSLASESPHSERASYSATPGTTLTSLRLASTGAIVPVERIDRGAVEALWMQAAWSLQAEIAAVATHGNGDGFVGHAQSLLATWSPTGDARSYKRGVVGAPSADNAWELALRWSAIDLDDGAIQGGRVQQYGVGATWYCNKYLRVIANLVRNDSRRRGVSDDPTIAGLRVQLTY